MTALYGRQSVDKGEQSLSIESQIEECKKRVPSGEVVEVYRDRGFSGSNTDRPDFTRLMDDIRSGHIQRLIVWKLDRISRSLMDFANILATLEAKKVVFDSVTEQLDTASPMGRAMINIIMVFAQLERETIQMRIASNYIKRAERGFFLGGTPLFGLAKKPITVNGYKTSTYELCPEYGQTILLIFEKYADNKTSLGMLARHLNENGYKNPSGVQWEAQKISRLLHNPTYVQSDPDVYQYYKSKGVKFLSPVEDFTGNGLYLFGKSAKHGCKFTDITGFSLAVALHKGIIDSQTFLKIQYKLDANTQIGNNGKSQLTWLSGLVKCGLCGYAMTPQLINKKYTTLRCSRCINKYDCEMTSLRAIPVEDYVWSAILSKLDELRGVDFNQDSKLSASQSQIKLELVKVEEQIDRFLEVIAEGNAPKSIAKRITDLEERQAQLLAQFQKEKAKEPTIDTDALLTLVRGELSFDERKEVAKAMIERVLVKVDDKPVIEWRF